MRMFHRDATSGFFAVSLAFTFCLQLPAALAQHGYLPGDSTAYLPMAMLGVFGPLVAACWLTFRASGLTGVKALWRGLLDFRVSPTWYVMALCVPGVLLSGILWLLNAAGRQGPWHFFPSAAQLASALVISVAEEIGWRGYALPRLMAKYGAFLASTILGLVWAIWHIPMFAWMDVPWSYAIVMLLYFVGGSLFFTFVYMKSNASLLIAVLAHLGAHVNNSHAALPADAIPLVAHTIVYAALGLVSMRSAAFALPARPRPVLRRVV